MNEIKHGTRAGYRRGGCTAGSPCPATPTCAQVETARRRALERVARESGAAPAPATIKHGTEWGYRQGCKAHSPCPASPTCAEVRNEGERRRWAARHPAPPPVEPTSPPVKAGPPPIQHGTPSGYRRGCRATSPCPASPTCTQARMASDRARDAEQRQDRLAPYLDSAPLLDAVAKMRATGLTYQEIATAAGVPHKSLAEIVRTQQRTARRDTVEAVVALASNPPQPQPKQRKLPEPQPTGEAHARYAAVRLAILRSIVLEGMPTTKAAVRHKSAGRTAQRAVDALGFSVMWDQGVRAAEIAADRRLLAALRKVTYAMPLPWAEVSRGVWTVDDLDPDYDPVAAWEELVAVAEAVRERPARVVRYFAAA